VWSILRDALDWLGPNDHGHPWPQPNRQTIREALDQHRELWPMARNVAIETKTTVLDQNRAPNIAGLFASKIRDYGRARAERAA
jgi:hypothetical protein